MTFDTNALTLVRGYFRGDVFFPSDSPNGDYPKPITSCEYMLIDGLVFIRNIETNEYDFGEDDSPDERMEKEYKRLLVRKRTLGTVMKILMSLTRSILNNSESSIRGVILRLDLVGKAPACKLVKYGERYAKVAEFPMPGDGINPFHDDMRLPEDINSLFKGHERRRLLYIYITHYFMNNFVSIPNGKRVILDGCIIPGDDNYVLSPSERVSLPIEKSRDDQGNIHLTFLNRAKWGTKEGETDLAAFEWLHNLVDDTLNTRVENGKACKIPSIVFATEDGDWIVEGILRASAGILPGDNIYIRKKRTIGSIELTGKRLEVAKERKKTNPRTRLTRTKTEVEYIDIRALARQIVDKSLWYGGSREICPHPIETLCFLCFLCGNDFVESLPNVGWGTIWDTFIDDTDGEKGKSGPELYGKIITVDLSLGDTWPVYGVRTDEFESFVLALLFKRFAWVKRAAASERVSIDTLEEFLEFYSSCETRPNIKKPKKVYKLPTLQRVWATAANIAWSLGYFANGERSGSSSYCMDLSEDNSYPLYGFSYKNPTLGAVADNIAFSEQMGYQPIFWSYYTK